MESRARADRIEIQETVQGTFEMVRVQSASRLHFGLLNPGAETEAKIARRFGGVGLMVHRPGLRLKVRPAPSWSASGPLAERALAFARQFAQTTRQEEGDLDLPTRNLHLEQV